MLQVRNLSNVFQKRLIRPLYAQTQATPWAGSLHSSLRNSDGSFRLPLAADNISGLSARSADAFSLQGGLVPGTVLNKAAGETFSVATGADAALVPAGLLANFVGGTLDDLKDNNEIGVWYGPGSQFELLAPAWDDTGLAAAYAAATAGSPVKLYATAAGKLGCTAALVGAAVGSKLPVAELVERRSASVIQIKLLV